MGPLEGIRVLDLSRLLPGPFATLVLQDLGAQVDKLEDAGAGDYLRHLLTGPGGVSTAFVALNRGKRSAILDLKSEAGREAFRRLLRGYDVLFEQFRPGVLERLGLGHERLLEDHSQLIVCALTGFGQSGPLAGRAGHDLNYLARSGVLAFQGPADGPPQVPGFQLADVSGGLWSALGVVAALRERDRTGRGKVVDIAMTDSVLGFATPALCAALNGASEPRGEAPLTGGLALYGTYLSQDGQPVTLAALEPKFWQIFCDAVGFALDMSHFLPGPHQSELRERLADLFSSRTATEWEQFAEQHDCCVAVALSPDQLADDPQLVARRSWVEVASPEGSVRCFRTPLSSLDPPSSPAPQPGEHTRIMLQEAGLSAAEIAELLATGAAKQWQA